MSDPAPMPVDGDRILAFYRERVAALTDQTFVQAAMVEQISAEKDELSREVAELRATVASFETARQVEAATLPGDSEAPTLPGV